MNPSKVPIENEKEGWADVHSSIYREFHYGYAGGLYNAMDYDVFSGPSVIPWGFYGKTAAWNGRIFMRMKQIRDMDITGSFFSIMTMQRNWHRRTLRSDPFAEGFRKIRRREGHLCL